jgi:hypothetical protein
VTSFIQVRPEPQCKGKVIGADNFAAFTGMIVAGQLFPFLDTALRPSAFLMFLGLSSVAVALLLWFILTSRLFTQKIS